MKVYLRELRPTLTITIHGDEPWLTELYKGFEVPSGAKVEPKKLEGSLDLRLEEGGTVQVRGRLAYVPVVACSRCDMALAWPLSMRVDTRFYPPPSLGELPKERSLSEADLDAYELDGDMLNLEQLVIDTVNAALPDRILPEPLQDGKSCSVCLGDLTSELVYGKGEVPEKESPFSALKGLKLPN